MADGAVQGLLDGVLAVLLADSDVAADVAGRVYDEPPQDVVFPYLRFGRFEPDADDTHTDQGLMVDFGIEVHSRPTAGRVEATRIAWSVRSALHRRASAVTIAGVQVVSLDFLTQSVARQGDGKTYQGTLVFRARLNLY